MKERKPSTYTFSVIDMNINGLNIGGVLLAAKFGNEAANMIHVALHDFIGEIARSWDEKRGEGSFADFCESLMTIEEAFFQNPDEDISPKYHETVEPIKESLETSK